MVRYIKDGAYTIVVDDTSSQGGGETKPNTPNAPTTPNTGRRSISDSSKGSKSAGSKPNTGTGHRPSSRKAAVVLKSIGENGEEEEVELEEEDIDYTSTKFILQNLAIAVPKPQSDPSHTLSSRRELAEMSAHQVCFYVYCLLQAYVNRADSPIILLFGDGFMGSRLIHHFRESGCNSFLRIFCRGEVGAKAWRERGYVADWSVMRLLAGEKPTVVVLAADYYSFHHIFHLLTEHHLMDPETAIVAATLGFQRKKLYYNFSVPTIFRVYLEPGEVQESFKLTAPPQPAVGVTDIMRNEFTIDDDDDKDARMSPSMLSKSPSMISKAMSAISDNDSDTSSIAEPSTMKEAEKSAVVLADRSLDIKNILYLLENFYTLQDLNADDARKLALRAITGYVDQSLSAGMGLLAKRTRAVIGKKERMVVKLLEKAILLLYHNSAVYFQREFSKRITLDELNQLSKEFVVEALKVEIPLNKFQEEKHIRGHRKVRTSNASSTSAAATQASAQNAAATEALKPALRRENTGGDSTLRSSSPPPQSTPTPSITNSSGRHAFIVDQSGAHHFVRNGKAYHPMHDSTMLYDIFNVDEDYTRYESPAFDYMRKLDNADNRKTFFKGASRTQIKLLFNEVVGDGQAHPTATPPQDAPSEPMSPSEMSPDQSPAGTPMHFRRQDPNVNPLRIAQRNLAKA